MPSTRTVRSDAKGLWIKVNGSIYRPPGETKITQGDLLLFFEKEDGCSVRVFGGNNEIWSKDD
jgi:hypothetical protein